MTGGLFSGERIGAVILAAGRSQRMGQPKMILPWGTRTVIEQVVDVLAAAGVKEIVVVTGGAREQVEAALAGSPARMVFNPLFEQGEMLSSLQTGLRQLSPGCLAALVALGDQPWIDLDVVRAVLGRHRATGARLVVPSYQMRRGHPWLVERGLWGDLLEMTAQQTMRDFLRAHEGEIVYEAVDSPGILKDLDTPEDYQAQRPA